LLELAALILGQVAAPALATPPPLGVDGMVTAVQDCFAVWKGGSLSADALEARHWHTAKALLPDGTMRSGAIRESDKASMALIDAGCVLKSPLAADATVAQLSTALTKSLSAEPRYFGRDPRWITTQGLVQIHLQQERGTFMAVIVQVAAASKSKP